MGDISWIGTMSLRKGKGKGKGKGFLSLKEEEVEEEVKEEAEGMWAGMVAELLGEIIKRVERSEEQWPNRQNVVACGCVCKRWREITRQVVRSPSPSHISAVPKITFPSCLKQVSSLLFSSQF